MFELCVRAVILDRTKQKIFLCRPRRKRYWFFPGGHIEFGERAEAALTRELKEELGVSIKHLEFIGAVENVFRKDREKHHELNLVFSVQVDMRRVRVREDHIVFGWHIIANIRRESVLPRTLKMNVLEWFKNRNVFWGA